MQSLYKNDYFYLLSQQDKVYIEVFVADFQIKQFDQVLQEVPRVALTQFANLKNALQSISKHVVEIGTLKPRVELTISNDLLQVKVKLNVTAAELEESLPEITAEIMEALNAHHITDGLREDVLKSGLKAREEILIAQGEYPVHGEDAVINYYVLSERKPVIQQNGTADYYEMNFLDEVKKDEWLGEKIKAGEGTPGLTVTGEVIPAKPGKDKPLHYDKNTIVEVDEGDKVILRAKTDGVVTKVNGNISVEEVLVIEGDVGGKTGNIDYDGCVTIKGTINDGFSVHATKDISVLSDIGLGAIDSIVSRTGDIYIKGGIFGKEKALIQAAQNVYMKHANECTIQAGGDIHIGLYAIGCKLTGNNIYLDVNRGRIIGGEIHAKAQVVTAIIGNEAERATSISIEGFDRNAVKKELDDLVDNYRKLEIVMSRLQGDLESYQIIVEERTGNEVAAHEAIQSKYEQIRRVMASIDERRNALNTFLRTKGEGEVSIMRKAFPKTSLNIKELQKEIENTTTGVFFVKDKTLFFE
ncbi:DUF342 domain-containing protein [Cohnella silvisoli]|uniref:FapA family protein n=1 Tax=Cohnella silvisoli TaxID=2873699 RepID=A0ABV1KQL9_9BACL|nr:FapA family protein [Cohnella silvisoli]MCD9022024.1 FapA family protein [Cohnella silvisoli]